MTHCKHCQRGIPLQHGIHMAEFEMTRCERTKLTLEPMTTDTWHQPEKRLQSDVPFTCGGGR